MMHKAWRCLEEVPYCFSRSSIKFQGHTAKKSSILTQIGCCRTVTPFWIHQWLWNDAQNLKQHRRGALFFFQGHSLNFRVARDKKLPILTRIERFRTVTPYWINSWLWNNAQSLIAHRRGAYCFSRSFVQFQGHTAKKNRRFWPKLSVCGL